MTLIPELADEGLLLQWAIELDELDDTTTAALIDAKIDLAPYRTMVLLAQAGRTFWDRNVTGCLHLSNPFDQRSNALVGDWFTTNRPGARWLPVYPGEALLPLGQLAEQAGWGLTSPLGLTIHREFGLWLAHRIVFLTDIGFDSSPVELDMMRAAHPCATCVDKPCISACPVGAVAASRSYDVATCAHHRISDSTKCAHTCLARNACPVGAEHRYGSEQMRHHYGAGLQSIIDWLRPEDTNP